MVINTERGHSVNKNICLTWAQGADNNSGMRDTFIKIRASKDERDRWQDALSRDGRTLSEVCRAALERIAKRKEREAAE